jgi:CHAD domain-containing protein
MAKAKPIVELDIHAPTETNARIIAKTRLEELYSWEQYVDNPYHVRELHNLRIAAKRLRYTLEIFGDILPSSIAPLLKEIEQIQEELGSLHDSDVMIALLRLCLGAQDAGSGYEYILAHARKFQKKADFVINPDMVAFLLDSTMAPSATERHGLESLLLDLHPRRNELYTTFRQHWYALKAQDFRSRVLTTLGFE